MPGVYMCVCDKQFTSGRKSAVSFTRPFTRKVGVVQKWTSFRTHHPHLLCQVCIYLSTRALFAETWIFRRALTINSYSLALYQEMAKAKTTTKNTSVQTLLIS